jgi:hypothetical protein
MDNAGSRLIDITDINHSPLQRILWPSELVFHRNVDPLLDAVTLNEFLLSIATFRHSTTTTTTTPLPSPTALDVQYWTQPVTGDAGHVDLEQVFPLSELRQPRNL